MKASIALESNIDSIRTLTGKHKARNPRVFGSVARGTDTEDSDIDIIVDILPEATLFDLGGLQAELEELLGMHVDLLTPGYLPPHVLATVLQEARPL